MDLSFHDRGGLSMCRHAPSRKAVGCNTLAQRPIQRREGHTQVVTDFFDELKSRSKGYASMEYKVTGYRVNDLVRLDIKVCRHLCRANVKANVKAATQQQRALIAPRSRSMCGLAS